MCLASVLLGLSLAPSPGAGDLVGAAEQPAARAAARADDPRPSGGGLRDSGRTRPTGELTGRVLALRAPGEPPGLGTPAPGPAATSASDVEIVRAAALRLHEEQQYAGAAALLERLAAETGRDDLLFDAGQSRFAAGHRAHALRLWQTYAQGPGRSAADLALVTRRIADARALTTAITVVVHVPSDMSQITLEWRRLHDAVDGERPPIAVAELRREGAARSAVVGLDPGVWELAVTIDGREVRRELVVGRAPQTLEVAAPAPPAARPDAPAPEVLPRFARTRRSAALLALAGPTLATGVALVVLRTRSFDRHVGSCALGWSQPLCTESAILDNARFAAAGGGLVGAGLGLVATGVTAALPVRRRVWIVHAIVGGAALVAGAAWLGAENVAYRRSVAGDYLERVGPWFDRRAAAASLLGLGIGLAQGVGIGLLPPSRRARATAWTPILSPAGVGLAARF